MALANVLGGFPGVYLSPEWYSNPGDGSNIGFGSVSEGAGEGTSEGTSEGAGTGTSPGWAEGSNFGGIGYGLSGNLSDIGLANAQSNAGMFGTATSALASALGTVPGLVASLANNANMSGLQNANFAINPNNPAQVSFSQGWPTTSTFGLMAQNSAPIALANAILGLFGVNPISFVDNMNLETEDASNIAMNTPIAQNMIDAMTIMQDMAQYADTEGIPGLGGGLGNMGYGNLSAVAAAMGLMGLGPSNVDFGEPGLMGAAGTGGMTGYGSLSGIADAMGMMGLGESDVGLGEPGLGGVGFGEGGEGEGGW